MTYNNDLIDFFKRHNIYEAEMFKYLSEHSTMIDYDIEEYRPFVGCFPKLTKDNHLIDVYLNMPYVKNNTTMLISIHELVHGIECYQNIGKIYKKDITVETLPLLYEKIYIQENNDPELTKYGKYLDNIILTNNQEEYLFGLKNRDYLLRKYDYNISKMQKAVKKLAKRRRLINYN